MLNYSISVEPPADFKPTIEVASCYCEHKDKLLLVKRHTNKPQGNTWGVPAGKLEAGESPRTAVIREVYEEVGLDINGVGLEKVGALYGRLGTLDYVYHMFRKRFFTPPTINLALDEHHEARWVTMSEALELPLICGGAEALNFYQQFIDSKKLRHVTRIGAYGIVLRDQHILLILEKPEGTFGGLLNLPGGGIEFGESPEEALQREFKEEVGMSFESMQLVTNLSNNMEVLNREDPFHFHHLGQIYRVFGWNEISDAIPEESFAWYPIKELSPSTLTPFARAAVELLTR